MPWRVVADEGGKALIQPVLLGLGHWSVDIANMNNAAPTGGDISHKARVSENDSEGQRALYGDSSSGKNLMLSKFHLPSGVSAVEDWDADAGGDWNACAGCSIPGGKGPKGVQVLLTGTATLPSVTVEWSLTGNSVCADGVDDFPLAAKVIGSVGSSMPFLVSPDTYDVPPATPTGAYKLCAEVDPGDAISETNETDNDLKSERDFTVTP